MAHQGLVAGRHARFNLKGDRLVRQGEQLIQRLGCRRCHVIGARGIRLAANLDQGVGGRGSAGLVAALKNPAVAMPDFRLDEERIDLLINALLAAAAPGGSSGEPPLAVHFRRDRSPASDPFSVKCGPCHKALSSTIGAAGRGSVGPDLSGLFTPFYPVSATGGEPWTVRRLATWLKNPRTLRPWGVMRPVPVTAVELEELAGILAVKPAAVGSVR